MNSIALDSGLLGLLVEPKPPDLDDTDEGGSFSDGFEVLQAENAANIAAAETTAIIFLKIFMNNLLPPGKSVFVEHLIN